jgi:hypothetical protein
MHLLSRETQFVFIDGIANDLGPAARLKHPVREITPAVGRRASILNFGLIEMLFDRVVTLGHRIDTKILGVFVKFLAWHRRVFPGL